MPATTRSTTPCVICGRTGEPSKEHVVGRRVRDALGTRGLVREYSGTTYVGATEALAIVLHGVCVTCNRGWLEYLDRKAWSVLEPILLGAAPGAVRIIDPADQATQRAGVLGLAGSHAGFAGGAGTDGQWRVRRAGRSLVPLVVIFN